MIRAKSNTMNINRAMPNIEGTIVDHARGQVVMAYTVGVAVCLAAFYFTPAAWPIAQWVTVFFIGFFLYGPQMLIGLCGAELVRSPFCPSL